MKQFHTVYILCFLALLVGCSDQLTRSGEVKSPGYLGGQEDASDGGIGQEGFNNEIYTTEYFNYDIGDSIYFELDQSTLSEEAKATLGEQARWLSANPSYIALIEGHADERGTREYNLALGARRADSVRSFLVENGVEDSRISVVSYGKERPFVACSDESCWSKNRRAKTLISLGQGI